MAYSHADWLAEPFLAEERERAEHDAREAAVDAAYLRLKRDDAAIEAAFTALLDSGVPATNEHHAVLIERIGGLSARAVLASDAETMHATARTLLAILATALEDELIRRAEAEVRA